MNDSNIPHGFECEVDLIINGHFTRCIIGFDVTRKGEALYWPQEQRYELRWPPKIELRSICAVEPDGEVSDNLYPRLFEFERQSAYQTVHLWIQRSVELTDVNYFDQFTIYKGKHHDLTQH
jgi:hypothetical protein